MADDRGYTDQEQQDFVASLYKSASDDLEPLYKATDSNLDDFLKAIASILLTYSIIKEVMSMTKGEQMKEYVKASIFIKKIIKKQSVQQESLINTILKKSINNTLDFYNYNPGKKVVQELIDEDYKGKHFSKRVWSNEKVVGEHLHLQMNEFLKGNISVNDIKKNIEATFNTSKYNAGRLVETEVAKTHNSAFDRFCVETDVKTVKYNAVLEACPICKPDDGRVFSYKGKIRIPRHPFVGATTKLLINVVVA